MTAVDQGSNGWWLVDARKKVGGERRGYFHEKELILEIRGASSEKTAVMNPTPVAHFNSSSLVRVVCFTTQEI